VPALYLRLSGIYKGREFAEDLLIVGTSYGLLIGDGVQAVPALYLRLSGIYKGREFALVSEVHLVCQAHLDEMGL
jgi:hypothetical protein